MTCERKWHHDGRLYLNAALDARNPAGIFVFYYLIRCYDSFRAFQREVVFLGVTNHISLPGCC